MGAGGGGSVELWTPTGGQYCDPKLWRRNTALAFVGIAAVCVPIFLLSAKLEERPITPAHFIPSQWWCKNFPKDEES